MLLSPLTALHLAKLAQKDRLTLENSQCKACLSRAGAQWPTVNRRNKGHGLCDTGAGGQDQGLQGCCDAFKAVPRVWNVHKSCRCPDFMVRGATSRILILQYQNRTLYEGSYVNKVRHALQGKGANKTWFLIFKPGQSHSPDFTPCDLLFFSLELSGIRFIATWSSKLQKALWTLYLEKLKQTPSNK